MLTPKFWRNTNPGILSFFLTPFSWVWKFFLKYRLSVNSYKVDVPVICVGNINMGGVGKTPTVIALIEKLKQKGLNPHVLSKGYGGKMSGPLLVSSGHNPGDVGDEPILISAFAPTWISKDRVKGAKAAVESGCDVIILDDGFQNQSIYKDFSIIVVDATIGFGNGKIFPAGPLRESIENASKRGDIFLLVGGEKDILNFYRFYKLPNIPVCNAKIKIVETGIDWENTKVLAFAGIGYPEKFFRSLNEIGAKIIKEIALADHANLSEKLLKRLKLEANMNGAILVTTEKDAIRLPANFKAEVITLPIKLHFNDWKTISCRLEKIIKY